MFNLDFLEALRCVLNGLVLIDLAPGLIDTVSNQRTQNAIAVCRIAPRESAFDAAMTVIGLTIIVWRHAHSLIASHLRDERATDAAICTRRLDAVLGLAVIDNALLHERRRRTGLHTCAAGHAFGIEKVFADTCRHPGFKSTTLDR